MNGDLLQALVVVVVVVVGIGAYVAWFASKVKVYRCYSCVEEFRAKGLAGRVGAAGVPGAAKYRTTCPKCGKRGLNLLVGYANTADLSAPINSPNPGSGQNLPEDDGSGLGSPRDCHRNRCGLVC